MVGWARSVVIGLCTSQAVEAAGLNGKSMPLDLSTLMNNKGFGRKPLEAAFDVKNDSYPDPGFKSKVYTSAQTGIEYSFPGYTGAGNPDNVICAGQTIPAPSADKGSFFSASFLVAGDLETASVSKNVTFTYTDNTTSLYELRSLSFFNFLTINRGEIILPNRYTGHGGVNYNTTHIFERSAALTPGKQLASITLPTTTNVSESRLHIFSISLYSGSAVEVQSLRPTQKWWDNDTQVVEVTLNNAGSECVSGKGLTVELTGDGFTTVRPGVVQRLCPGDQQKAYVGVKGGTAKPVDVVAHVKDGKTEQSKTFSNVEVGLTEWTSDSSSLAKHESPEWFDESKFGIFLHWGPYAVTGWGNSTPYESYAEWFWWYSTHPPPADRSGFREHRLRTYGKDWAYDDTFPDFTADKYDPKEIVDLIADAGAKYFVLTTKHHDGFAIFDAGKTSNRTSLHYGPKRDLLGELFEAAAKYHPTMKRGTYFSLPEWFHPDWAKYGFDQFNRTENPGTTSWTGGLALNPYTGVKEPYTGYIPVNDYISDLQVPQMETLAYKYGTDIMWCDCGASNGTAEFAARWWNEARKQNRQVAINSRCGTAHAADFDTPEYQTFSSAQDFKWESNRGMDPYSYGYNRATKDEEYMNATTIVHTLVDMVSKHGNFLLNIGPKPDGTIAPIMADNLRIAGRWIKRHETSIYNTTYWYPLSQIVGSGDGATPDVRFTRAKDAFYTLFLEKPKIGGDGYVTIPAAVPVLEGDEVSLLGVGGGEKLDFKITGSPGGQGGEKSLKIKVDQTVLDNEDICWVFKIKYVA
ncbi:uncharacterized protein PgNI_09032 [Pyricularia grisea]|uniref:alpha-L-fucosidase n=1 Tax=Pyricularia grisea TaxID=148305 RepID=A0A6P8AUN3_PYRGI|nr:uncharacterized protein PgNI_09032 [Pyricularia grisea]TLD05922.1 hypothetical protein PgNI_09032 [Pyricularia grisea]